MNVDEIAAFNEQIAALARSGLPIDRGLESMAAEMVDGRLRRTTEALAADLRLGIPLPEAIEKRGTELPPYYAAVLRAGVRMGSLADALSALTQYARTTSNTRRGIIDAMTYPTIVLYFAGLLIYIFGKLLAPQFFSIFHSFGLQLPAVTKGAIVLVEYRVPECIGLILILSTVGFYLLSWLSTRRDKLGRKSAELLYLIPVLGTIIKAGRLSAFADLLATLVEYQVPLDEAFRLVADAAIDPLEAEVARTAAHRLSQGMPLAESLQGNRLLSLWIIWSVVEGEKRGQLAQALRRIAEYHRRQVDLRSNLVRRILPHGVIVGTTAVVSGFFIAILLLPMMELLEGLTK